MVAIDKINNFLGINNRKVFLKNGISLTFLQFSNYLFPLITLPYLTRILGPEKFGLISFSQAFIQYFVLFTDYGFNLSATREISINRYNNIKVSEIFSSVLIAKILLFFISFFILIFITFYFKKFREDLCLYYFTFGFVIGQVLFPIWFFQGIENMKYIALINIWAKIFFTILIFVFIKKSSDYIYVPLINSIGFILSGIIGLYVAIKKFNIKLFIPDISSIIEQANKGKHIFASTLFISVYTNSNIFLLGFFASDKVVGYYSLVEKIVRIIIYFYTTITQVFYPYISFLFKNERNKILPFIRKIILITLIYGGFFYLFVFLLSNRILYILGGGDFILSQRILILLAPLVIIIPLNHVLANLLMLPLKLDKYYFYIYLIQGLLGLGVSFTFLNYINNSAYALVYSNLIVESFSLLTFIYFFYFKTIKMLKT